MKNEELNTDNKVVKFRDTYFLFFLLLFFAICRLPVILHNQEINPDESQVLTQALTLKFVSPVWGVAVDGTTSGPLNTYFLYFLNLLGLPLDYTTAHLANVLLCVLSLIVIFKICQKLSSNQSAQIAILIPVLFLSFTQHSDLVSYNSEMLSVLLTSVCGYLLVLIYDNTKTPIMAKALQRTTIFAPSLKAWGFWSLFSGNNKLVFHIFSIGFVASLVPFAKIQAVFIVLGILILLLALMIHQKLHFKYYAIGILGAVLFPAFFFGVLFKNNVLSYFLDHYITGNAAITKFGETNGQLTMTPVSAMDSLKSLFTGIGQSRDLMFLVLNVIIVSAWCLVLSAAAVAKKRIVGQLLLKKTLSIINYQLSIILFFTLYAIAKPGIGRVHYFLFLLLPLTVWVSVLVEGFGSWVLARGLKVKSERSNSSKIVSVPRSVSSQTIGKVYEDTNLGGNVFSLLTSHFSFLTTHYALRTFLLITTLLNLGLRYKSDGTLNKYKIQTTIPATTLGLKIAEYANPNEAIAIWGWACQYHVEVQSPQATRHNHSILETIENYPYRAAYYQEYLVELSQNLPPVIVDAVGTKSCGIKNRLRYNLNQYAELRNLVNNNYVTAAKTNDYVVYVRKDRY